jgi:hypothetical protein
VGLLGIKIILTPLLIAMTSLAARRWGQGVGGWLVGLPLTSGPVSAFLAIEQGRTFAAEAAHGTIFGIIAVAAFCVAYARICPYTRWPVAFAGGVAAYVLSVWLSSLIEVGLLWSLVIIVTLLLAALQIIGRLEPVALPSKTSWWDIPSRMVAATGMVLLITGLASRLGPNWSGLLSPFPVFTSVMGIFAHVVIGPRAAQHLLRGVVMGSFGFAFFFLTVGLSVQQLGLFWVYLLASLAGIGVNLITLALFVRFHRI